MKPRHTDGTPYKSATQGLFAAKPGSYTRRCAKCDGFKSMARPGWKKGPRGFVCPDCQVPA